MVLPIIAATALSILAVISLILYAKNQPWLTVIVIPLALFSSIELWRITEANLGKPIEGLPEGEVQMIMLRPEKPNILFVVRKNGVDKFYSIPYTEQNSKVFDEIKAEMQSDHEGEPEKTPMVRFSRDRADLLLQYSIESPIFPIEKNSAAERP